MIVFQNKGEIDLRGLTTFGLSAKETDDPFGFFGTGLKYAVAVLMRTGHRVFIQRGAREYVITSDYDQFRGKDVELYTLQESDSSYKVELPFTSELGKTWDVWQAYRELYCNAMDENGETFECERHLAPEEGLTRILVRGNKIAEQHTNKSAIVLSTIPIKTSDRLDVHAEPAKCAFYKGIRVYDLQKMSKFTYNMRGNVTLTEDRTLKYTWELKDRIAAFWMGCTDKGLLEKALLKVAHTLEGEIYYGLGSEASDAFAEVIADNYNNYASGMSHSAREWYRDKMGKGRVPVTEAVLSPLDERRLKRAKDVCRSLGHDVDGISIKIVSSLGYNILGCVRDGVVLISKECFEQGTKRLAGTIMEECIHVEHELSDETREMQDFLVDRCMSLYEEWKDDLI